MKNTIALAGMISIFVLAYVLDLLLSLAGLGVVEGIPEFFTQRNAWLLPISFIIFFLAAILLAWYVIWHSRPGRFVRLVFLVTGIVGLLFPTILHTFIVLFYNSVGFLVTSTTPILSAYFRSPYLFYQTFAYMTVIGTASMIGSRDSTD